MTCYPCSREISRSRFRTRISLSTLATRVLEEAAHQKFLSDQKVKWTWKSCSLLGLIPQLNEAVPLTFENESDVPVLISAGSAIIGGQTGHGGQDHEAESSQTTRGGTGIVDEWEDDDDIEGEEIFLPPMEDKPSLLERLANL